MIIHVRTALDIQNLPQAYQKDRASDYSLLFELHCGGTNAAS
jgi:hypothetical protein